MCLVLLYLQLLRCFFFDSLFEKNSLGISLLLTILFGGLSILLIYVILDVWLERILVSHNRIIYKGVFGKKEIQYSNIKGFVKDGQHTSIYSKDDSIIISFDNKLKSDEKITSYLEKRFESLSEDGESNKG